MHTYTQEVKDQSRLELWERAVHSLTIERKDSAILNPRYITRLWDYAFDEILEKHTEGEPNEFFLDSWIQFAESSYSSRSPGELRIAYFCGPEPENDIDVLVQLGVRIENVWAIESDKSSYRAALQSATKRFPTLKIFHGSIESLIATQPSPFDIIYLDFTSFLYSRESKPIKTIHAVFDSHALTDLGVLIINSTTPDHTDENVDFLACYFFAQPFVEGTALSQKTSNGEDVTWFTEGPIAHGHDLDSLREKINGAFDAAYSAFATHYPMMYANYIAPIVRVARNPVLKKLFFETDEAVLQQSISKMSDYNKVISLLTQDEAHEEKDEDLLGGELIFSPDDYPLWHFLLALKESKYPLCQYWHGQFSQSQGGMSILGAIQLRDLFREANYSYLETLSKPLKEAIPAIIKSLPDRHGGLFCDVPMAHLWAEIALNQLGVPYHTNLDRHWRSQYKAKTRKMNIDLFVFDRCRAYYDWLPLVELQGNDMHTLERQIISRSCLDAISKQIRWPISWCYFGANLICINDRRWSNFSELKPRVSLEV